MMKLYADKVRLWQAIQLNCLGGYDLFFLRTDPLATRCAMDITNDPAGWVKCFLMQQGWKMDSIKKLIHKAFDEESTRNANLAPWDQKTQRVISGFDV